MVSIIIPVYNVQDYLNQCIESVVNQDIADYEIILVDDGSTDLSGQICDKWANYDSRIRVIHKVNGGLSSARNAGLEVANGDYIAFVDSDDWIEKSMFKDLLNLLELNRDVDIAACGIELFNNQDYLKKKTLFKCRSGFFSNQEYLALVLRQQIDNAVWNKLYRRNVVSGHRFVEGVINEDFLFNIEVLSGVKQIAYITSPLYKYRVRKGSITQQANPRLFDFVENAINLKERILNIYRYPLMLELNGYIYSVMTNYIATLEKYHSADLYKDHLLYCKKYINRQLIKAFLNRNWKFNTKLKYLLISLTPSFYRFLLKWKKI